MAVAENRPNSIADGVGSGAPSRSGKYSEAFALPIGTKELSACAEGSYYVAQTPTPGTGIIDGVVTSLVKTTPSLTLYNGGTNRVYLQYIDLYVTVASVGESLTQFTFFIDNIQKFTSGGTALTVKNTNMDSTLVSGVVGNTGVITAPAASASERLIAHVKLRDTIPIIGDSYHFNFGGAAHSQGAPSRVATVADFCRVLPPVCLGPGHTLTMYRWAAANSTGLTSQVNIGFIER